MTSDFESFHFFPVSWNKLHKNGVLSQLWNSARKREGRAIYQIDVDVFGDFLDYCCLFVHLLFVGVKTTFDRQQWPSLKMNSSQGLTRFCSFLALSNFWFVSDLIPYKCIFGLNFWSIPMWFQPNSLVKSFMRRTRGWEPWDRSERLVSASVRSGRNSPRQPFSSGKQWASPKIGFVNAMLWQSCQDIFLRTSRIVQRRPTTVPPTTAETRPVK